MHSATGTTRTGSRPTAAAYALTAVIVAALSLGLAAPRAARADAYLGSSLVLSHAPDAPQTTPIDTVYWLTALANNRPYRVSQDGQIEQFQIRGHAGGVAPAPIHFQILRPTPAGLEIVASSQAYSLPATDGVWSYDPVNFCVKAGDYLGFNVLSATALSVFGAVSGSTTDQFSANNGTMNGDIVTPAAIPNVELLLSAFEGTGPHASALCGGIQGVEFHIAGTSVKVARSGAATIPLTCTGPLSCAGTLSVLATQPAAGSQPARSVVIATSAFSLASHRAGSLPLTLSTLGRRLLKGHRGRLPAVASASLGAAGPDDTVSATVTVTG